MESQQIHTLSWEGFSNSLTAAAQLMRDGNEMVDVTLAAGGKIFPAHRLILSAASPLIKNVLKSTQCHHPVVMLAGISAGDLEALLKFVYEGQVSVEPTQLPSLLQAAQCLDIQALSLATLRLDKLVEKPPVPLNNEDINTPKATLASVTNFASLVQTTQDCTNRKRKRKLRQTLSSLNSLKKDMASDMGESMTGNDQLEQNHTHSIDYDTVLSSASDSKLHCASEQPSECPLCGLQIRQARNLRRHLLSNCPSRPLPNLHYFTPFPTETPEEDFLQGHHLASSDSAFPMSRSTDNGVLESS